jgi:hypothetical protein|tara:strand:+ start:724 stop:1536 length:813 start_codon:yes stop_codon:yes gene_type:complete
MARHNKKRNTAFIYESLVREIVKQSVAKNEEKRNVAIGILKESFSKNTELRKELDLYKTLLENNNLKEKVAEKILVETKNQHSLINQDKLFKEQSITISKINKNLSKNVFNNFVPNYKFLATISQVFGVSGSPKARVLLETHVIETLMSETEAQKQMSKIPSLVVKTFVKRFNDSYSSLLENQKQLLSNYISSFADNGLEFNFYLNEEIERLKKVVATGFKLDEAQEDKMIRKKMSQVTEILENTNKAPVTSETLHKIMQIQALAEEIIS